MGWAGARKLGENDEEIGRIGTYACRDVMPVHCVAGADAWETEGAVCVQAERFFDDSVEVL